MSWLILMAIGAGMGWLANYYGRLGVSPAAAAIGGAFGGLMFAAMLRLVANLLGAAIGGIVGALIVFMIARALQRR